MLALANAQAVSDHSDLLFFSLHAPSTAHQQFAYASACSIYLTAMALTRGLSPRYITIACCALALMVLFYSRHTLTFLPALPGVSTTSPGLPSHITTKWIKPLNPSIIGLVFYGRRDRVQILNCYLEVGEECLGSLRHPMLTFVTAKSGAQRRLARRGALCA